MLSERGRDMLFHHVTEDVCQFLCYYRREAPENPGGKVVEILQKVLSEDMIISGVPKGLPQRVFRELRGILSADVRTLRRLRIIDDTDTLKPTKEEIAEAITENLTALFGDISDFDGLNLKTPSMAASALSV